jgi:hypothetical protein
MYSIKRQANRKIYKGNKICCFVQIVPYMQNFDSMGCQFKYRNIAVKKGGPGAAVEPIVCNRKVLGSNPSLCILCG